MKTTRFLKSFAFHPVQSIRILPQTGAIPLLLVQLLLIILASTGRSLLAAAPSIQLGLLSSLAGFTSMCLLSVFLHYFLILFQNLNVQFIEIHRLVVFSHIPLLLSYALSSWSPPFLILGYAVTTLLMAVGLVENFEINKKLSIRLNIVLFSIFLSIWIFQTIKAH